MALTDRQRAVNRARVKAQIALQNAHRDEWNALLNAEYVKEGITRREPKSK